jgi:hypothetical protein
MFKLPNSTDACHQVTSDHSTGYHHHHHHHHHHEYCGAWALRPAPVTPETVLRSIVVLVDPSFVVPSVADGMPIVQRLPLFIFSL